MRKVYAFDFDGTLTTCDTLLAFIRYAKGTPAFVRGFLRHAHLLVLMKLRLYPNIRTGRPSRRSSPISLRGWIWKPLIPFASVLLLIAVL